MIPGYPAPWLLAGSLVRPVLRGWLQIQVAEACILLRALDVIPNGDTAIVEAERAQAMLRRQVVSA